MSNRAQTIVRQDGREYKITRVRDGKSISLWHVGRCWKAYIGGATTYRIDIAGSINSADKIVRYLRRALLRDELPFVDMHCTGW